MINNNENTEQLRESQYNLNEQNNMLIADLQREAIFLALRKRDYVSSLERWNYIRILCQARFEDKEITTLDTLYDDFYKIEKPDVPNNLNATKTNMIDKLSEKQQWIKNYYDYHRRLKLDKFIRGVLELMRKYKISSTDKETKNRLS